MQVEVLAYSRACALPQIQSDVEPFRMIKTLQGTNATLSEFHHFGDLRGFRLVESSRVRKRGDHEMAGRIGEQIQNDEIFDSSVHDQPFRIPGSVIPYAKDASGGNIPH